MVLRVTYYFKRNFINRWIIPPGWTAILLRPTRNDIVLFVGKWLKSYMHMYTRIHIEKIEMKDGNENT